MKFLNLEPNHPPSSQAGGHAGIINTINYAKKVTGITKIYAVLGGFHLTGVTFNFLTFNVNILF